MNLTKIRIETERLTLRPVKLSDAVSIFNGIKEVTEFMTINPPRTVLNTSDYIQKIQKSAQGGTDVVLTILKKDGELIGAIGLHHITEKTAEIGIWTKKGSHGNKYGQEATQALVGWVEKNLNLDVLTYPVAEKNIASRKVASSCGGLLTGKNKPINKQNGEVLPGLVYEIHLSKTKSF